MSGIYIPINAPQHCYECAFCIAETEMCAITNQALIEQTACPLVPVPPHGRLIDAEQIQMFITAGLNSGEFGYDQIKVLTEIQYAPTILPADVADNGV